jgi:hypothetical protein
VEGVVLKKVCQFSYVTLCLVLLAGFTGCAGGGAHDERGARQDISANPNDLSTAQDRLADFADNHITAIGNLYDGLLRDKETTTDARREALRTWLVAARAALINATDDSPVYGMMNMVILVRVERYSCSQPWFEQTFGATTAATARALAAKQDQRITNLASQYLTSAQMDELDRAINAWLKTRPVIRVIDLVRVADLEMARSPEEAAHGPPGSIFDLALVDPFANLAPAVREAYRARLAARRIFYYAQRWPGLLRVEGELLCLDLLAEPQVTSAIQNASTFNTNAAAFNTVFRQFSENVTKLPNDLKAEREKAVEQLRDTLTTQRDAAIKQIAEATAKERSAAVEQVAGSADRLSKDIIDRAVKAVATERDDTLSEVRTIVNTSQRAAVADLDALGKTLVTRLVVGLCVTTLFACVSVALTMLAYRWLAHRTAPPGRSTPAKPS